MFHIVQEKKLCLKTMNDKVDRFDNISSIVRIQWSICNTAYIFLQTNVLFKKNYQKYVYIIYINFSFCCFYTILYIHYLFLRAREIFFISLFYHSLWSINSAFELQAEFQFWRVIRNLINLKCKYIYTLLLEPIRATPGRKLKKKRQTRLAVEAEFPEAKRGWRKNSDNGRKIDAVSRVTDVPRRLLRHRPDRRGTRIHAGTQTGRRHGNKFLNSNRRSLSTLHDASRAKTIMRRRERWKGGS